MSKAFDLPRVPPPPPPPEPKLCVACKGYRAECFAPVGESSRALCWLCAHHVVDHGVAPELATTAECECLPHQIYPNRAPRTRAEVVLNSNFFEVSREDFYKTVCFEWDVETNDIKPGSMLKTMTPRQREIYETIAPKRPIVRRGR